MLTHWKLVVYLLTIAGAVGMTYQSHKVLQEEVREIRTAGTPLVRQLHGDVVELKANVRELSITSVRVERIDERTANMQAQLNRLEARISKGVAAAVMEVRTTGETSR